MNNTILQMPERIECEEGTLSTTFGRFFVQPLEKGFGVTLGNSFRRVLLSSIPGTAITAVKFEGIQHEFSTIKGVVEDLSDIILNLKQVRIRPISKKVNKVSITLKGPGEFVAGEIQNSTNEIEILNPDLHIATMNKDASFEVELRIGRGKGYVASEENKASDQTIGLIPIDSIFTPIRNVRYLVEPTRVGGQTDFEKLVLEVETDGSLTPQDALAYSARVLREHIQLFINFGREPETERTESEQEQEVTRIKKILRTPVDELELSVLSHNCLCSANIKTIADLLMRTET